MPDDVRVPLQQEVLPQQREFSYLGITVGPKGILHEQHVVSLAVKFRSVANMFRPLGFKANGFRLGTRISLLKTFLRPILEYGLPFITNVAALVKLQSLQSQALRFMFSAPPRTSTTALHARVGLPPIATRQAILRARWLTFQDGWRRLSRTRSTA